ncbi:ABC transporter substrate-binding protein [Peptoniphilus equinus]|uniref:ABC transporter substrate-binding protein n=1 Tax=Peptoniphilus equinus TaxID=3016343 RepID=A0ABY7QV11_9FIRM|nr:ABC transporter substrate-binding protein [Peptoniphilus equinus]WBW49919.1 ABC transporter substrate-binding protein [Peptoniphilus equinus]
MKKMMLSGLIALLMLTVGCSAPAPAKQPAPESNAAEAQSDDGKIHIHFWYAWKDKIGESNEALVKKFNESQDKIVVEAAYQGTYDELHAKTQAAFAAGDAPEVTENEIASMGIFAKGGMTQDLSAFVDDSLRLEDFNTGLMDNAYVDGKLYGLPYLRSTPILYKNVDMLKAAGLDPAGPRTWDEFTQYCEALRTGDQYGFTTNMYNWTFEGMVSQAGGSMLGDDGITPTFNEASGVEAGEYWQTLAKRDLMKAVFGDTATETMRADFANKKAAMFYASTADLSYNLQLAKEAGITLDVSYMPKNVKYAVPTGGCNVVMTAGLSEDKQQAAWTFMKWLTDTDQTAYSSSYTGYLPSRYSALETDVIQNLYKETPQFKVAVDQLEYATGRPMTVGYPEVSQILMEEMTRLVQDPSLDVKTAFDGVAEQAKSILK